MNFKIWLFSLFNMTPKDEPAIPEWIDRMSAVDPYVPTVPKNLKPLLDFIALNEVGTSGPDGYDVIWGGIKRIYKPPLPVSEMTVGQVLDWQDSIDAFNRSEASGRYQIMEDTLRGIYQTAGLSRSSMFNKDGQDALCLALLKRRGLHKYLSGEIPLSSFCNRLAMEWASLPVVTNVQRTSRGKRWTVKIGASYYSGDGLNKAHARVQPFLDAVKSIK